MTLPLTMIYPQDLNSLPLYPSRHKTSLNLLTFFFFFKSDWWLTNKSLFHGRGQFSACMEAASNSDTIFVSPNTNRFNGIVKLPNHLQSLLETRWTIQYWWINIQIPVPKGHSKHYGCRSKFLLTIQPCLLAKSVVSTTKHKAVLFLDNYCMPGFESLWKSAPMCFKYKHNSLQQNGTEVAQP